MTDKLIERIKAYRSAPTIYDAPDPVEMANRILADAKILEKVNEARNEALREAADLAKYEGGEFAGMREGVMFDRLSKKILDLITEDQIDE